MDFRFGGILPDDHVFLNRVRPLVDWTFKFISWLVITSTFGVAAEVTKNAWLWAIYFLGQLLLIFFLQSFFSWLFEMKFARKEGRKPSPAAARTGFGATVRKARTLLIAVFAFLVWIGFQVGMQQSIGRTVDAIAEFQKASRK
jgi:hypothetical protein